VVAESAWHFGGVASSSPIQFAIPNLAGEVVQLTGRSANASDVESRAAACNCHALADRRVGKPTAPRPRRRTLGWGLGRAAAR
jgi:hypothetical protein